MPRNNENDSVKYMELYLDKKLSWEIHIPKQKNKSIVDLTDNTVLKIK